MIVKEYTFYGPNNEKMKTNNLPVFCEKHGLNCRRMHSVFLGKMKSHKQWTKHLKFTKSRLHTFLSPDREKVNVRLLGKFCKQVGLDCPEMYKVSCGRIESHQGWTKRRR